MREKPYLHQSCLPKISVAIPTFNEEKNIAVCLESIFAQNYPPRLLEVIIVDDYSRDRTLEIAKRFPVKILYNGSHDAEVGKMIAFNHATGNLFYYLDADAELRGNEWFQKMTVPLEIDKEIIGVFTKECARRTSPSLERYFAMDPLLRDPVHEFFSPSIDSTVVNKFDHYALCKFEIEKIPPAGRCLYRKSVLDNVIKGYKKFLEMDILKLLAAEGFTKFAYVPQAGIYHHYIKNLPELIKKRKRNIQKVYLTDIAERKYRWINLGNPRDILKIFLLIFYAHTIFFSLTRGIYKSLKYRDLAGLWEPIVALFSTDTTILSFLFNQKGRQFILGKYSQK